MRAGLGGVCQAALIGRYVAIGFRRALTGTARTLPMVAGSEPAAAVRAMLRG